MVGAAVEQTQGIFFEAGLAVVAKRFEMRRKIFSQSLVICRAAGGTADRIDVQLNAQSQIFEQGIRQRDYLRVRIRALGAEDFHAELMKFAQSARLRPLVAERGNDIIHFRGQDAARKSVFDKRPRDARRPLGLEGNRTVPLVAEGVHFFCDDICGIADAAQEYLRMLEHGRADFFQVEQPCRLAGNAFHVLPFIRIGR